MKKLYVFTPLFMIFALISACISPYITMSEDISHKVLRLHILANSDTEYDQSVKLLVRDSILDKAGTIFSGCSNLENAISAANDNIDLISSIADATLREYDCPYSAMVCVTEDFFGTREYDGFALPGGVYHTIRIVLGNGEGHNWWCVMFPQVCIPGCSDGFDGALSDDEIRYIKGKKYIIRFKTVELYEKIKYKIMT